MNKSETRQIEQRLVAVLKKDAQDAIGYTLLTVLWSNVHNSVIIHSFAGS